MRRTGRLAKKRRFPSSFPSRSITPFPSTLLHLGRCGGVFFARNVAGRSIATRVHALLSELAETARAIQAGRTGCRRQPAFFLVLFLIPWLASLRLELLRSSAALGRRLKPPANRDGTGSFRHGPQKIDRPRIFVSACGLDGANA